MSNSIQDVPLESTWSASTQLNIIAASIEQRSQSIDFFRIDDIEYYADIGHFHEITGIIVRTIADIALKEAAVLWNINGTQAEPMVSLIRAAARALENDKVVRFR